MASILYDIKEKPSGEEEFVKWMEAKFEVQNEQVKSNYESNTARMLKDFKDTSFWKKVGQQLKEWDVEYYTEKGVHLFAKMQLPDVLGKPYESLLNKAYRKDCLKNNFFPEEPKDGWICPNTWFVRIHDIIRTMFTVKYLDGVKFLDQKLKQLAGDTGCKYYCNYEAHDDGYYAAHAAIIVDMDIVGMDWLKSSQKIEVEIQITTELQEMVKSLLHKYYEENRKKVIPEDYKWQWDYQSEQFVPNFLGHIAHYLEGMIVEIRDNQK